jgi:hypothetical protein
MASDYDPTEFVDGDFQSHKSPYASTSGHQRAPTIEQVDSEVLARQQKIAELARAKEAKERELASLEETRRRQMEFKTGRQEMIHNLTRGLGLLEEAEFNSRRDAEQMARAIVDLRAGLITVEAILEENWSGETFELELTRALTAVENARMEWNGARLKFPILSGEAMADAKDSAAEGNSLSGLSELTFGQLCRLGLALTWPLVAAALVLVGLLAALLVRR